MKLAYIFVVLTFVAGCASQSENRMSSCRKLCSNKIVAEFQDETLTCKCQYEKE